MPKKRGEVSRQILAGLVEQKTVLLFVLLTCSFLLVSVAEAAVTTCPAFINVTDTLDANISASGDCLIINASNLIFNCNNNWINGSFTGSGILIGNRSNVTVGNCTTMIFDIGIDVRNSTNITLASVNAYNSSSRGISVINSISISIDNGLVDGNRSSAMGIFVTNTTGSVINASTSRTVFSTALYCESCNDSILRNTSASSQNTTGLLLNKTFVSHVYSTGGTSNVGTEFWIFGGWNITMQGIIVFSTFGPALVIQDADLVNSSGTNASSAAGAGIMVINSTNITLAGGYGHSDNLTGINISLTRYSNLSGGLLANSSRGAGLTILQSWNLTLKDVNGSSVDGTGMNINSSTNLTLQNVFASSNSSRGFWGFDINTSTLKNWTVVSNQSNGLVLDGYFTDDRVDGLTVLVSPSGTFGAAVLGSATGVPMIGSSFANILVRSSTIGAGLSLTRVRNSSFTNVSVIVGNGSAFTFTNTNDSSFRGLNVSSGQRAGLRPSDTTGIEVEGFNNSFVDVRVFSGGVGHDGGGDAFGLGCTAHCDLNYFANVTITVSNSTGLVLLNGSANNVFYNLTIVSNSSWIMLSNGTSQAGDGNNITNLAMEMPNTTVRFPGLINLPNRSLVNASNVNVSFNHTFINTTNLSWLDMPSQVIFRDLKYTNPVEMIDPEGDGTFIDCTADICTHLSYSEGILLFNVTGWSAYSARESVILPEQEDSVRTTPPSTAPLSRDGVQFTISGAEKVSVPVGDTSYIFDVIRTNGKNGAEIAFGAAIAAITVGQTTLLDVDGDGKDDVTLKLAGVTPKGIEVFIEPILAAAPLQEPKSIPTVEMPTAADEKETPLPREELGGMLPSLTAPVQESPLKFEKETPSFSLFAKIAAILAILTLITFFALHRKALLHGHMGKIE